MNAAQVGSARQPPESPTVPYAIDAKARPELGWDWGKGATNPQFQIHLENKALTLASLMSPRVSERGLIGRPAQGTLRLSSGSSGRGYSAT